MCADVGDATRKIDCSALKKMRFTDRTRPQRISDLAFWRPKAPEHGPPDTSRSASDDTSATRNKRSKQPSDRRDNKANDDRQRQRHQRTERRPTGALGLSVDREDRRRTRVVQQGKQHQVNRG